VDRQGERLYFLGGYVCVDVQSGTQEQRKAVMDTLVDALRKAGVSVADDTKRGT
jgi:hypothetical protein